MSKDAAIIVGGSGGIGEAICNRFAAAGVPVMLTYRSRREAAERVREGILATGGHAAIAACDLTVPDTIASTYRHATETFGGFASIVFASGPSVSQSYVSELSLSEVRATLEADVIGFLALVQQAIPVLKARGGGSIVALSSIAVHRFPPKDILGGLPKSGIEMLCRAVAKEEGRFGIRANSIAPGFIEAGLGKKFMEELYSPDVWDRQRRATPLRRFGQAAEIANVAYFLASAEASFVTGQNIIVDGGFCL